jgi:hypothetical protein
MATKRQVNFTEWPKPIFSDVVRTNKHFAANYRAAIMFAHYELSALDLKKEVVKWIKTVDPKHRYLDVMKDIHENRFATVGKYTYVLNNKGDVPETIAAGLMPAIEKIIAEEEAKIEAKKKEEEFLKGKSATKISTETAKVVISIQDRIKERTREVAGEIEGWIDDFYLSRKTATPKTIDDFANLFKASDLKAPHLKFMHTIFEKRSLEISTALEGKNKDLVEAYSNFTKPELKKFDNFFKNLLKSCEMAQEVAKVVRAPRKKKPVSQEKLVAKLKYKKEDTALGIVSLNPVHIIGSKEVWVYNTKTRKLAQYKALDASGLTVKGASLENFSTDSAEKTLRKPAESLADFKKASKVKLRTFLKDLTTLDIPAPGKLNEHHVILRIDK